MAELAPAKFKVGDLITVHTDTTEGDDAYQRDGCTGAVVGVRDYLYVGEEEFGRSYVVHITSPNKATTYTHWNIGENNLKFTNPQKEEQMTDLIKEIEALDLTDDQRMLVRYALVEANGVTPTGKGIELAQVKLFQEKTADILKDLAAVEAARAKAEAADTSKA